MNAVRCFILEARRQGDNPAFWIKVDLRWAVTRGEMNDLGYWSQRSVIAEPEAHYIRQIDGVANEAA